MTLEGSNFHQMAPNSKCKGMVSLKTYQCGLLLIFIILYNYETLFGDDDKKAKNY